MSKKNNDELKNYWDVEEPVIEPEQETPSVPIVAEVKQEKRYYYPTNWKGIIPQFKCDACGYDDANEDDMKLHVLIHVPGTEREIVFNQLMEV